MRYRAHHWMFALCVLGACTGGDATETYARGAVLPIDGFGAVGIWVGEDGSQQGYACGQGEALSRSMWLFDDDDGVANGDWTARLDTEGDTVTMTVSDGTDTWSGEPAPFAGGGLYDASPSGCRTGLLAWSDGADGLQSVGTWCDTITFAQVEPIGTIIAESPVIQARVDNAGEVMTFDLTRLP